MTRKASGILPSEITSRPDGGAPSAGIYEAVAAPDEFAAIVELTTRRLDQLVAEGMPKSGRAGYPVVAALRWMIDFWKKRATQSPLNEARRRKIEAEATAAELTLAAQRGDLASVSAGAAAWGAACARLRTRLLAVPSKVAPQVQNAKTPREAEAMIRAEIAEALEELAGDSKTAV